MPDDNTQGQQQQQAPANDWKSQLPENLRFHEATTKFKDVPSLFQSYVELERSMGSRISLPKETDKPETYDKFYKAWGRPDKPDAYSFPELPEGLKVNDEFGGQVKSLAHKLGLNQAQFNALVDWGKEQSLGMMSEQTKAVQETEAKLKNEWGFRYTDNVEKAHKTLAMLVDFKEDHPFIKYAEEKGLDKSPEFMKFLLDVSKKFGEDVFVDSHVQQGAVAAGDAKKKINEIRADPKHPYWNENDPRHQDALKEMNGLYDIAHGEVK